MSLDYLGDLERLAALESCAIMGTGREPAFDNLVFTAAQLLRVPVALAVMVGADRIWIKAGVWPRALDMGPVAALARSIVRNPVEPLPDDLRSDPRFLVPSTSPQPRFGGGLPFLGPGSQRIGAFCIMDFHVRGVSERQMMHFCQLAEQGSELLRLRVPGLDVREHRGLLNACLSPPRPGPGRATFA